MHFNILNDLYKFRKRIFIIQLENLHLKSDKVLKELCKIVKIILDIFSFIEIFQPYDTSISS